MEEIETAQTETNNTDIKDTEEQECEDMSDANDASIDATMDTSDADADADAAGFAATPEKESTTLSNDKIEKCLYAWLVSLHIAILLDWMGLVGCCWVTFLTLGFASCTIILSIATMKVSSDGRAVLITGCDEGFAHALAIQLEKVGFTVIACCLHADGEGAEELRSLGSEKLDVVALDICSEESCKAAREKVDKIVAGKGLWGLVNEASLSCYGGVEWVPTSHFKMLFDVNLIGLVNVTKTFLPLVRKAKGRIVNSSSMLGRMGQSMASPFAMCKYAVEGFSECLRHEMKWTGVDVILMEPGNYSHSPKFTAEKTPTTEEILAAMSEEEEEVYTKEYVETSMEYMNKFTTSGTFDTTSVVNAYVESLTQVYPQARYNPAEWDHKIRLFVAAHLPEFVYDNLYSSTKK